MLTKSLQCRVWADDPGKFKDTVFNYQPEQADNPLLFKNIASGYKPDRIIRAKAHILSFILIYFQFDVINTSVNGTQVLQKTI